MRIVWCIAVLAGCYTSSVAPPVAPTPQPSDQVDERPAPDRTYRKVDAAKATCDDPASFDCVLMTFTQFRDRACDCSAGDKVCADAVIADMTTWSQNMAAQFSKANHSPTPEQSKLMSDVTTDFTKCLTTAMTPRSTPTTP